MVISDHGCRGTSVQLQPSGAEGSCCAAVRCAEATSHLEMKSYRTGSFFYSIAYCHWNYIVYS